MPEAEQGLELPLHLEPGAEELHGAVEGLSRGWLGSSTSTECAHITLAVFNYAGCGANPIYNVGWAECVVSEESWSIECDAVDDVWLVPSFADLRPAD